MYQTWVNSYESIPPGIQRFESQTGQKEGLKHLKAMGLTLTPPPHSPPHTHTEVLGIAVSSTDLRELTSSMLLWCMHSWQKPFSRLAMDTLFHERLVFFFFVFHQVMSNWILVFDQLCKLSVNLRNAGKAVLMYGPEMERKPSQFQLHPAGIYIVRNASHTCRQWVTVHHIFCVQYWIAAGQPTTTKPWATYIHTWMEGLIQF